MKTYSEIKDQEAELLRVKDRARTFELLTRENESAKALVSRIEKTLSEPDDQTELLSQVIELSQKIDSRFVTKSGLGVGGGRVVAQVILSACGDAMTQATRLRASLETGLPEAKLRLEDSVRSLDKFRAKLEREERERVA